MLLIATGQPTAKLDADGETITLRIPSGDRESVKIDLTPNQFIALTQKLRREEMAFWKAQTAKRNWQAENVIPFPAARRA